jgi:hypothetical protein
MLTGDGFKVLDLPEPLGRTVIGICMGTSDRPCCHSSSVES